MLLLGCPVVVFVRCSCDNVEMHVAAVVKEDRAYAVAAVSLLTSPLLVVLSAASMYDCTVQAQQL